MFQFKQALAAGSVALFLAASVGAPSVADAADGKPAVAKVKKGKRPVAKKSAKATKPARATKASKRQAKVNVKASLGKTDKLLKVAARSAGKEGHADLHSAAIQQLAARKALAAGKEKQAMFLSLDARRMARSVIADKGKKVPRGMATDSKNELANVDAMDIEEFVDAALEETDGTHEDPPEMDGEEMDELEAVDDTDVSDEVIEDEF